MKWRVTIHNSDTNWISTVYDTYQLAELAIRKAVTEAPQRIKRITLSPVR
jgi:hypothetical protein